MDFEKKPHIVCELSGISSVLIELCFPWWVVLRPSLDTSADGDGRDDDSAFLAMASDGMPETFGVASDINSSLRRLRKVGGVLVSRPIEIRKAIEEAGVLLILC